jgi:transposase
MKPPSRRRYATDLKDSQWAFIEPLIPEARPGGRARKAPARQLVNAILYFLRAGVAWRLLPHDLPPRQTVYYYPRRWQREGVGEHVHHTLIPTNRERWGWESSLSAAILDSQSVRTADQMGAQKVTTRARRLPGASGIS